MSLIGMGLNQEALDNLKPTSTVFEVNDINAENGPAVVVDTNTGITDEKGRFVIDNFEDFDIVLQDFEGQEAEQVRLEDMAQIVMANESICLRDVQQFLNGVAEEPGVPDASGGTSTLVGFVQHFKERLPEASFTDEPSKINLAETKRLVKRELDLRQTVRADSLKAFMVERCDSFLKRACDVLKVIETEIEEQNSLQKSAAASLERATTSDNYLAYVVIKSDKGEPSKDLYDIRHAPLDFYRLTKVLDYGFGPDADLIFSLGQYLSSEAGKAFIKRVTVTNSYHVSFDSPYLRTTLSLMEQESDQSPNLSYMDLLSIYARGDVVSAMTSVKIYLESKIQAIAEYKRQVDDGTFLTSGDAGRVPEMIKNVTTLITSLWDCAKLLQVSENVRQLLYPAMAKMDLILYTPAEA